MIQNIIHLLWAIIIQLFRLRQQLYLLFGFKKGKLHMRNKYLQMYKRSCQEGHIKNLGTLMTHVNHMYEAMGAVITDMEVTVGRTLSQNYSLHLQNKQLKENINNQSENQKHNFQLHETFSKRPLNQPKQQKILNTINIGENENKLKNIGVEQPHSSISCINNNPLKSFSSQLSTIKEVTSKDSQTKQFSRQMLKQQLGQQSISMAYRKRQGEGSQKKFNKKNQKSQPLYLEELFQKQTQQVVNQDESQEQKPQNICSITSQQFQDIVGVNYKSISNRQNTNLCASKAQNRDEIKGPHNSSKSKKVVHQWKQYQIHESLE